MPPTLRIILGSATNLITISIEVHFELNQHGWCFAEFRATNENRPEAESWLGQELTLEAQDDGGSQTIFSGIVWQAELHHDITGGYNAVVIGVTRTWVLECTHDQNAFRNKTLTSIAQELASKDGVQAQVDIKDDPPFEYLVQWGHPDLAFLVELAYERRAWIRPSATGIEIRSSFDSGVPIKWGNRLLHYAIIGRIGQPSYSGTHYDPHKTLSQTFTGVRAEPEFFGANQMSGAVQAASQKTLPSGGVFRGSHAATAEGFRSRLEIESQRSQSNVYVVGVSREFRVGLGNKVEIQDLRNGDGDGTCGVVKAIHTWNQANGYKNEFVATLSKTWVSSAAPRPCPPARIWQVPDRPGLVPTGPWADGGEVSDPRLIPWNEFGAGANATTWGACHSGHAAPPMLGVVIARVKDNNDPLNLGRLKVQYIWSGEETDWIRMVSPSAGGGRGILFLPEIGDEVLVAFEDGDPNRPIIIGSLWNGVNNAGGVRQPFKSQSGIDNNDVKRIVTKCGHRITLCDTAGEQAITIATAFGSSIKILQKHPETGFPMIALETPDGDIILSAPNGRVHVNSKFYSREVG
jgi:type VI secretion system secreted protein VgrG